MRSAWKAAGWAALVLFAAPELPAARAHAQELRLGRPAAPEIGEPSFAADLAGRLDDEIALLNSAAEGEPSRLLVTLLEGRANVRRLAQRLLLLSHEAGAEGSIAFVSGFTLASGRDAIDRALALDRWPQDFDPNAIPGGSPALSSDRFTDAYWALVKFNESASDSIEGLGDPPAEAVDAAVSRLVLPLRQALESMEGRHAASHWPLPDPARAENPRHEPEEIDSAPSPSLGERLAAAPLPQETRSELMEIHELLKAAEEFPEFQHRAVTYRRHIEGAMDYAQVLDAADWAPPELRDRALARLHAAVLLFSNRETRSAGEAHLARLVDERGTLERLIHLSRLPRHRIRPAALQQAFFDAEELLANPASATAAREHLARLHEVLERMIAWREMKEPELRRELKVVSANLDRRYERAEAELLEALAAAPAGGGIGSDPNLLALLADHAQILRDLVHVRSIPEWTATIETLRSAAAERFEAQARRTAQWLIDPARRAEAVRRMNELAHQMAMFAPMPFEEPLRAGTAEAASVTGGQHAALYQRIVDERARWIDSLAEGESDSEALAQLLLLYRLTRTMAEIVELAGLGEDVAWLNRWAAWHVDDLALAGALSEVPNRLRLASQAAVNGDAEDLATQLDRIDAELPLAALIGRIAATIGPALRELPEDGLAVVEQAIAPPGGPNGWLANRRGELARICRYASEEAFARSGGRSELADACAGYANALARDLVRELDEAGR